MANVRPEIRKNSARERADNWESESERKRGQLDSQQKVWAGKRKPTQGGVSNSR